MQSVRQNAGEIVESIAGVEDVATDIGLIPLPMMNHSDAAAAFRKVRGSFG